MVKRTTLGFDLNGNPIQDQYADEKGREIFEKGKLLLVINELDGELSVQIMGPPSEKTLELLQHAVDSYKKIVRRIL